MKGRPLFRFFLYGFAFVAFFYSVFLIVKNAVPTMEEGLLLIGAELVLDGRIPNADFEHLYGPADLWSLAGAFALFGVSLTTERLLGLAYRLLLMGGLYRIGKSVSPSTGAGAAICSWLLIIPFGLIAYSWVAALAFSVTALALAAEAGRNKRKWFISGLLAGIGLLYRPDLVIAIAISYGWLLFKAPRTARWSSVKGGLLGLSPYLVHLVTAGPINVINGIFIDPVFRLRAGRRLPLPPRWSDSGDFFTRVDDFVRNIDPWPALGHPAQLTVLFFLVLLSAVLTLFLSFRSQKQQLIGLALFAVGIVPQLLQRPSPNHFRFVGIIVFSSLITALAALLKPRLSGLAVASFVCITLALVAPHHVLRSAKDATFFASSSSPAPTLVRQGRTLPVVSQTYLFEVEEIFSVLDAHGSPGDSLFIGPVDLRRTNYSESWLYHLLPDFSPSSYYLEMNPGLANSVGGRLADELTRTDWLILSRRFDSWNEPNDSSLFGSLSPSLVVSDEFCLQKETVSYQLLRKCAEH